MGSFYGASGRASVFDRIRAKPRINDRDNNYCFLSSGYDIFILSSKKEFKIPSGNSRLFNSRDESV